MGVFGQLKNKKKTDKQRKTMKWRRRQRSVAKQKHQPDVNVEDLELFSKDMIKNKMKNLKNNINLSNKKRNRLLKRLRHGQRQKEKVEADTDEQMVDIGSKKSKKVKVKGSKSSTKVKASTSAAADLGDDDDDVEMEDDDSE
ncbi:uncharacterized protein LOC143289468 [Babylonia areolata]|uniref:uncharacterized protein LOC143289468 n=1 Tax=Babylonia areolata TaxID=304850 RepID=UPI003FD62F04